MMGRSPSAERWLYAGLVFSTTAAGSLRVWGILRVDGLSNLKLLLFALFTLLFCWIAGSFWMAVMGACVRLRRLRPQGLAAPSQTPPVLARTAIVMPICNEDVAPVFARLAAIDASLHTTGASAAFDIFVLSDSTSSEKRSEEESAWRSLRRIASSSLYYRNRSSNRGRKSGNIRDFCRSWGGAYDYMIVLDADSLMSGETLLHLVSLMNANPRAALMQVPPHLIGRQSLFARLQQFASSVYGPLYWEGLAFLQGADSNYWGHNAIVRLKPFMQHCGLPRLSGKAPLGGEILSHDFVEAALLSRAGWELWMVPELGGSYEESPPSLMHWLKRDRRWCEGNLQHMRLIFAQGFRGVSRLHLAVGVMTYLSAPLWFAMLVVASAQSFREQHFAPVIYSGRYPALSLPVSHTLECVVLVLVATLLLLGPKFLGLFVLGRERNGLSAHGGLVRALCSVLVETLFSTLLAPVVMMSQTGFVAQVFAGRSTIWGTQQRGERRLGFVSVVAAFAPHMVIAAAGAAMILDYIPSCFWWLAPLLAGPILAIPLVLVSSSAAVGRMAARLGLLLVPSETVRPPVVALFDSFISAPSERVVPVGARKAPISQAA